MNVSGVQATIQKAIPDMDSGKNLKTTKAAGEFESLLIAQMLKSMREEGSGWLGTGEDKSADSAMGFAEEQLAVSLSAAGGLGLAKIVQSGLQAPGMTESVGRVAERKGGVGNSF
jgi:Rod binding domain-containing protein